MECPLSGTCSCVSGRSLASGDAQLPFDEIETRDHFSDRVFDLQARVHFHEIEIALRVRDELDGARADITDGARGVTSSLAHRCALGGD